MKQIIFLMLLACSLTAQNTIDVEMNGNHLCIHNIEDPGAEWYQYHIQNGDNWSEVVSFWSHSTDTCIISPYCNVRVTRTAFWPMEVSNLVERNVIDFDVKIWWNEPELFVSLKGDFEKVEVSMYDVFGNNIKFTEGYILKQVGEGVLRGVPIIKYGNINHPRVVRIRVEGNGCEGVVTKIIYI